MQNVNVKNVDCHATLAMIEKRWGFPRRTLRALLGMTKNAQSVRSLLEESGADAPTVLSAVYTDSTPAKNRQADVPQYGRSMIEMLGVLAIIGVLSVGGIAGYSKAMQKYRINKTIEQITLIAGNVRTFFAPQKNYIGVGCEGSSCNATNGCYGHSGVDSKGNPTNDENGCPVIKKAKILPDEMITVNADGKITAITNPFGGGVFLSQAIKAKIGDYQAFYIQYTLPLDEEVCIELVSQDWSLAGAKYMEAAGDGDEGLVNLKIPVSLDTAVAKCSTIVTETKNNEGETMYIDMYFDVDLNSDFYKNWSWGN